MHMRKFLCLVLLVMLCLGAVCTAQADSGIWFMGTPLTDGSHWRWDSAVGQLTAADAASAQVSYEGGVLTLQDLHLSTALEYADVRCVLEAEGDVTLCLKGSSSVERTVFAPLFFVGGNATITGDGSLNLKSTGYSALLCDDLTIDGGTLRAETVGMPTAGPAMAVVNTDALTLNDGTLSVIGHAPNVAALAASEGMDLRGGVLDVTSSDVEGNGVVSGSVTGLNPHAEDIRIHEGVRIRIQAGDTAILLGNIIYLPSGRTEQPDPDAPLFLYPTPAAAPATGDGAQPLAWMGLCLLSVLGAAVLRRRRMA